MKKVTGREPSVQIGANTYVRDRSGTYYHEDTASLVRDVLEVARERGQPLRIFLGDTEGETIGRDWAEEQGTIGHVARSMGPVKIPLLLAAHERGGEAILTHCIVRIMDAEHGRELYRHPSYKAPVFRTGKPWDAALPIAFYREGRAWAAFATKAAGKAWRDFMCGRSMEVPA